MLMHVNIVSHSFDSIVVPRAAVVLGLSWVVLHCLPVYDSGGMYAPAFIDGISRFLFLPASLHSVFSIPRLLSSSIS